MKNNPEQIIITGIGVVSVHGNSMQELWNGLTANQNAAGGISSFSIKGADNNLIGAEIKSFNSREYNCRKRMRSLGAQAIDTAIQDRGGTGILSNKKSALVFGSGLGFADQLSMHAKDINSSQYLSALSEKFFDKYDDLFDETIYIGDACSAGAHAMCHGAELLKAKYFDIVVAGGVDILSKIAYSGFLRLNAVDQSGCHPFDRNRKGIMVGEGAAFVVLERYNNTDISNKVYCFFSGMGISCDAHNVVQMDPNYKQIKAAMDVALDSGKISKQDINLIVAHGTGTIVNDKTEASFISSEFGDQGKKFFITAPKGSIGHTGGASGAFGVLVGIGSILTGIVPAIVGLNEVDFDLKLPFVRHKNIKADINIVMVNAFAFGGVNIIILLRKFSMDD